MPDEEPTSAAFLLSAWEHHRAEMSWTLAEYHRLERYALLATGAIWTALAATTAEDWDPLIKWLPFALTVLFALRASFLVWRIRELGRYLAAAERHFAVPPALALESQPKPGRLRALTAVLFWALLLVATLLLPFFYVERVTEPSYENTTSHDGPPDQSRSMSVNHLVQTSA